MALSIALASSSRSKGEWLDPDAGTVKLEEYIRRWIKEGDLKPALGRSTNGISAFTASRTSARSR